MRRDNRDNRVNIDRREMHQRREIDRNNRIKKRNNLTKEQFDIKQERIKKKRKSRFKFFILLIIVCIILGILTAISTNNFKKIIKDMSVNEKSVILDSQEKEITKIGGEKIKEKAEFDKIPNYLKNAYISIEDQRFYKHGGVDIKRTASATVSYILHRGSYSYGGSSITQQLVKNLSGDSSGKISRKVKEWRNATIVESVLSKDEILNLYLNIIYVGPNIYGVESGAKYYFGKSVENLSLEECAFLAGINNSPNSYNPFNETNSEKIKKRTKIVLSKMKELNYISENEFNEAVEKVEVGLKFKKTEIKNNSTVYSYHTDALLSDLIEDIAKKKRISTVFATNYIEMAGLKIYSTQDSKIQSTAEEEFKKTKYQLKSKNSSETSQAAMVIIDHKTGYVLGCVGGLGTKKESRVFNRATQSIRQTGSSIKPIAVLIPGIAKKTFTGATVFSDEKREFADGYSPENYSKYLGDVTVRRALESSQNIPFVEMMLKISPKTSMNYLKNMGITSLTEKDNNLALALGGLDKGISPLQMAGAYATIANDGVYIEPVFYSKVLNKNNDVVLTVKQKKKRVFSKEVAYIVKELLTQPVKGKYGTATYCAIQGMDVAAKTGTTDENYDRWLCGFTPYYTAVNWFGFDRNESISFNGNKNPAGIMWANIMARIHSNLSKATFVKPTSVFKATICADTGKKATDSCTNTYDEYFLFGSIPDLCTAHSGSNKNNVVNRVIDTDVVDSFDTTTKDDVDFKVYEEVENDNTTEIKEKQTQNVNKKTDTTTNNTKTNTLEKNTVNTNSSNTNSSNTTKNETVNSTTETVMEEQKKESVTTKKTEKKASTETSISVSEDKVE